MPPPPACLWARVGQGHDDSKTIFAMLLRLLQDASIIDALGITASFSGEAVEHRVRQVGGGSERGSHNHIRPNPLWTSSPPQGSSFGGGGRSWGITELHSTPELMFRRGGGEKPLCTGCGCELGHFPTCWAGGINS
jgi:hypothetical protein